MRISEFDFERAGLRAEPIKPSSLAELLAQVRVEFARYDLSALAAQFGSAAPTSHDMVSQNAAGHDSDAKRDGITIQRSTWRTEIGDRDQHETMALAAAKREVERANLASPPPSSPAASIDIEIGCLRGWNHEAEGQRCQDAVCMLTSGDLTFIALSDGVGSVPHADLGARILSCCSTLIAERLLITEGLEAMSAEFLAALHMALYDLMIDISNELQIPYSLAHELLLPATLTLAVISPTNYLVVSIGDGFICRNLEIASVCDEEAESDMPPLLSNLLFWRECLRGPEWDLCGDPKVGQQIEDESSACRVVAYGATEELSRVAPLLLATDGLRFFSIDGNLNLLSAMLTQNSLGNFGRAFALHSLVSDISDDLLSLARVENALALPDVESVVTEVLAKYYPHEVASRHNTAECLHEFRKKAPVEGGDRNGKSTSDYDHCLTELVERVRAHATERLASEYSFSCEGQSLIVVRDDLGFAVIGARI